MSQFAALLLTITIEAPVVITALNGRVRPFSKLLVFAIVPTLITHPMLWAAMVNKPTMIPYHAGVVIAEALVIMAEAYILRLMSKLSFSFCIVISLIANAASAMIGSLILRSFE